MKLNSVELAVVNNPVRTLFLRATVGRFLKSRTAVTRRDASTRQ